MSTEITVRKLWPRQYWVYSGLVRLAAKELRAWLGICSSVENREMIPFIPLATFWLIQRERNWRIFMNFDSHSVKIADSCLFTWIFWFTQHELDVNAIIDLLDSLFCTSSCKWVGIPLVPLNGILFFDKKSKNLILTNGGCPYYPKHAGSLLTFASICILLSGAPDDRSPFA